MSSTLDYEEQQKIFGEKKIQSVKESMVHVSASCSSLENKKAAVWKRRWYSALKGTAHGKPTAHPMANAPRRKDGSAPLKLLQDSGKMNFPGDEKPCCEFILCLCF